MLAADFQDDNNFYIDFYNRWISSLMKPQARNDKMFLLDIDDLSKLNEIKRKILTITHNYQVHKTPSGCHIYLKPFNIKLLPDIDIKKDGLMLIYWKL